MMLLCFLLLFVPNNTWAFVYQCVSSEGSIEYRDSPCLKADQTQSTLPIQYSNERSNLKTEVSKGSLQTEKKTLIAQRKAERLRIRTEKLAKLSENKAQKRKERCAKLNEKIERIEAELRAGCKLKRFNRLKTELDHCRNMKQRHCTREV